MGRHSAPDDDDIDDVALDAAGAVPGPVQASRPRPARHADVSDPDAAVEPVEAHALTDPTGIAPQPAPPTARPEPDDGGGGRIGRALPRPGGVVRGAAARTGPAPHEQTARPPADDDTSPGIAMIERALAGSRPTPLAVEPSEPSEPSEATDETDETVRIPIIADPVLDEPVPEAVTENMRPVTDQTAPPAPVEPVAEDNHEPEQTTGKAVKAGKAEKKAARKAAKQHDPSHEGRISDLALLRADSAVRARVAAAVIVPFVLYVAVLLVLDTFDVRTALIWIWIPLITAGVVGGLILDMAQRGVSTETSETSETSGTGAGADEQPTVDDQRSENTAH